MRVLVWLPLLFVLACAARAPLPVAAPVPPVLPAPSAPSPVAPVATAASRAPRLADGCPDGEPAQQRVARYLESIGGCAEDPAAYRDAQVDARSPLAVDKQTSVLASALHEQSAGVRTCVSRAWHVWPELAGTLHNRIVLDAHGAVVALSTQRSEPRNDPIACCIRRALRAQQLPVRPLRSLVLDYPVGLGTDWTTPRHPSGAPAQTSDEPLTHAQVQTTIERRIGDVRACYEAALRSTPTLTGRVIVRFVVDHDGSVPRALVHDNQTAVPLLGCCITEHMRTWVFPRPAHGEAIVVEYPFLLVPESKVEPVVPR